MDNRGEIHATISAESFEGAFRTMAQGVNDMVGGYVSMNEKTMTCMAEFSRGNFEAPLEKFPGDKASINETIERLRGNIRSFVAEMTNWRTNTCRGDIDEVIPAGNFEAAYRTMAQGVNDMVAGHVDLMNETMACVAEFEGQISRPL